MEGKDSSEIKLLKSDEVTGLMEKMHILDENIKEVIQRAENTGEKLCKPEKRRFLGKVQSKRPVEVDFLGKVKKVMVKFTCYAEYSITDQGYEIQAAYSHHSSIKSAEKTERKIEWRCNKCDTEMVEALLTLRYLSVEGKIDGVSCPKCDDNYVMEKIATGKLAEAEKAVEEKIGASCAKRQ